MDASPQQSKRQRLNNYPEWTSLPMELLEHIFEYISFKDQLDAMIVCKKWFELLQIPKFFDKTQILFGAGIIHESCPCYETFMKSNRVFKSIKINEQVMHAIPSSGDMDNFNKNKDTFWTKIGKHVEYVFYYNAKHNEFYKLLHYFPSLRELTVDVKNLVELHDKIPETLEKITLTGVLPYKVNSRHFEQFNAVKRSVKSLIAKLVHLPSITAVEAEFTLFHLSESVQVTLNNTSARKWLQDFDLVQTNMLEMKHFPLIKHFSDCSKASSLYFHVDLIGCFSFHDKIHAPHIRAVYLEGSSCEDYCETCIKALSESSTNIQHFIFYNPSRASNKIIQSTKKPLRQLNVNGCSKYKDFINLNFDKLGYLNLKCSTSGIETYEKIFSMSFPQLQELHLQFKKVDLSELKVLTQNCPKLTKFTCKSITVDELLVIEEAWLYLDELKFSKMENWKTDLEKFVTNMKGNFRRLEIFGGYFRGRGKWSVDVMFPLYKRRVHGEFFKKMPRLRNTFFMSYIWYCHLEYKIPYNAVLIQPEVSNYWTSESNDNQENLSSNAEENETEPSVKE